MTDSDAEIAKHEAQHGLLRRQREVGRWFDSIANTRSLTLEQCDAIIAIVRKPVERKDNP